jgi:hypothetical protein
MYITDQTAAEALSMIGATSAPQEAKLNAVFKLGVLKGMNAPYDKSAVLDGSLKRQYTELLHETVKNAGIGDSDSLRIAEFIATQTEKSLTNTKERPWAVSPNIRKDTGGPAF